MGSNADRHGCDKCSYRTSDYWELQDHLALHKKEEDERQRKINEPDKRRNR